MPDPILAATAVAAIVSYLLACWLWPFAACRRCDGTGKHRSPSGKAFRYCKRCKKTGARLRIGRKVWNYFRQLHAG